MEPSVSDFPIVEAAVLRPFQAVLEQEGAPPESHMRRAGLSPDQVTAGDGWIPKARAYGFMGAASRSEGIPDLGYRVGRGEIDRWCVNADFGEIAPPAVNGARVNRSTHSNILRFYD